MTSDDTSGHGDQHTHRHTRGAGPDPIREFLLGVAGQIDQLASLFGGTPGHAAAAAGPGGDAASFVDVTGEITSLLAEIGDLLARLIAALIAVLEAVATALRSAPGPGPDPTQHYQPIAVRIDPTGPPRARRYESEGEI
ncbi:hypothetical protein [Gordonia rhizosphera]|uniref:Uncharacterized protein n=1 Tax=Gordonia rhizosphera NBRC 16068 TaxID=1108045 RepID=K6WE11_9ACTN|nr:hypothetical protein [Gordonia rhizosphera]GAB90422.1 hypothetical protein GORHZ_102_00490 [Gordonia rhizosphera NBRC 16068]